VWRGLDGWGAVLRLTLSHLAQLDEAVRALYAGGATKPVELAEALAQQGYTVRVLVTLGCPTLLRCLHALRHTFLLCSVEGQRRPAIVDPHFREQFECAKASREYGALLAELPPVFVGTEDEVELLVHLLCGCEWARNCGRRALAALLVGARALFQPLTSTPQRCRELQRSFRAQDAHMPPWRSATSMLSKWRPQNCVDVPLLHARRTSDYSGLCHGQAGSAPDATAELLAPPPSSRAIPIGCSAALEREPAPAAAERAAVVAADTHAYGCSLPRQFYGFLPQGCDVLPS